MTTIIKVQADGLSDTLPRAILPYAEDCLGLWMFGGDDTSSRKNLVNPDAPLEHFGAGPVSFADTTARLQAPNNGYVTPFSVTPHAYTVGVVCSNYKTTAGGPGTPNDFSVIGSLAAQLQPSFYTPGGTFVGQGIAGEAASFGPTGFTTFDGRQNLRALVERANGLDLYGEAGSGGLLTASYTGTVTAAAPQPIIFGARPSYGTGYTDASMAFVYGRALSEAEMRRVYRQLLQIAAMRAPARGPAPTPTPTPTPGAPFTAVNGFASVVQQPSGAYRLTKTGGDGSWNTGAIGAPVAGDFTYRVDVLQSTSGAFFGVSATPGADTSFAGVEHAVYFSPAGHVQRYDAGASSAALGSYSSTFQLIIARRGADLIYKSGADFASGALLATIAGVTGAIGFDSSLIDTGSPYAYDLRVLS